MQLSLVINTNSNNNNNQLLSLHRKKNSEMFHACETMHQVDRIPFKSINLKGNYLM